MSCLYGSVSIWMKRLFIIMLNAMLTLGTGQGDNDFSRSIPDIDDTYEQEVVEEVAPTYLLEFSDLDLNTIPTYLGEPYYVINDNVPSFTEEDKLNPVFEYYSEMDQLGRCGPATANISRELMPTEPRGAIGHIRPSGWQTVKYPELISDLYLYNRCHLIAYALSGENANARNLITGTRYMNMSGMLPIENRIVRYIEETNDQVLYRVTPCFKDDELVARGVHIEALSLGDDGQGLSINVFVYNVQPGIVIDYSNGESFLEDQLEE